MRVEIRLLGDITHTIEHGTNNANMKLQTKIAGRRRQVQTLLGVAQENVNSDGYVTHVMTDGCSDPCSIAQCTG